MTDWTKLAIKIKARSAPVIAALEKGNFVKISNKVERGLREIDETELENQFATFINRLGKVVEQKSIEEIDKIDPKKLIKQFMNDPTLYEGVEMVMQATLAAAIKMSVESIAESVISKYANHNTKIRPIADTTANDEMFIAVNGPEIGEADNVLTKALNLKFGSSSWHFSVQQNLFRTSGPTVGKLLNKKSSFNIYK